MNLDQMRYLVVSNHRNGEFISERNVADLDRISTIRDIREGQFGEVSHVIEFNLAERIICDRTEDILREANVPDPPLTGQDLIDWRHDHERELRDEATANHYHRRR